MYLLDTNVVSEFRKIRGGKANQHVTRWSQTVDVKTMFLSAITIHELEYGVLILGRRDPAQSGILRYWLDERIASMFRDRILPIDEAVARRNAALHVPDPYPFRDGFIAATALVHGLTVVTRNVADFLRSGAKVLDPWAPA